MSSGCCGEFVPGQALGGGGGGGGGGVDVQDEGVALPGNPYSTLNFEAGVKADGVGAVARARGATATAQLTYDPNGTGNDTETFTDWPTLYAKLVQLRTSADSSGWYQIIFTTTTTLGSLDPVIIPSDGVTYDMTNTEWVGVFGATANVLQQIPVQVGGGVGADLVIAHLRKITGLLVSAAQFSSPITVDADETLTLLDTTISGGDERTPIIVIGAGAQVILDDNTTLAAKSIVSTIDYTIEIIGVVTTNTSSIQNNALSGVGSVTVLVKEGSARIIWAQAGLTSQLGWLSSSNRLESLAWPFLPVFTPEVVGTDPSVSNCEVGYTNLIVAANEATLPFASSYSKGDFIAVKTGNNSTTITTNGDLIDDALTFPLAAFESALLVSDGIDTWYVIASKRAASVSRYVIPAQWARSNIAVSLTDSQLNEQLSTNFDTYVAQRAGKITGISWRINGGPVTQGTLTVTPRINSVLTTLAGVSTSVSNQTGGRATNTVDTYVAGVEIDVVITTTANFLPADVANIEVMLEVSEA